MKKLNTYIVTLLTVIFSLITNLTYAQDDIPPPPDFDPGDSTLPIDQWVYLGVVIAILGGFLWHYYQSRKSNKLL